MSGRRITGAKAFRPKSSLVSTNARPSANDNLIRGKEGLWNSGAPWKDGVDQISTITSVLALVCLYGLVIYTHFMASKSGQFIMCLAMFIVSFVNYGNYLSANQRRKVENTAQFRSMTTLPRNVKRNDDGSYSILIWKPSKFSETVFLSFNPMVPVLTYIGLRAFDPLSSWLCIGLVLASGIFLHVMNIKFGWMVRNEAMLRAQESNANVNAVDDTPSRGFMADYNARRRGVQMEADEGAEMHDERYDGPTNAVFQIPDQVPPPQSPLLSNEHYHQDRPYMQRDAYQAHGGMGEEDIVIEGPPQPRRMYQPPSHSQFSPSGHSPQRYMNMGSPERGQAMGMDQPRAQPPSGAKRSRFGLRFDTPHTPQVHQQPIEVLPSSPYYQGHLGMNNENETFEAPDFHQSPTEVNQAIMAQRTPQYQIHHQNPTPGSAYGLHRANFEGNATPSFKAGFAPPPRSSIQDM